MLVDEQPTKLKKNKERPKSQRLPKLEPKKVKRTTQILNRILTIKELDEEQLATTSQVTRKVSPSMINSRKSKQH